MNHFCHRQETERQFPVSVPEAEMVFDIFRTCSKILI